MTNLYWELPCARQAWYYIPTVCQAQECIGSLGVRILSLYSPLNLYHLKEFLEGSRFPVSKHQGINEYIDEYFIV